MFDKYTKSMQDKKKLTWREIQQDAFHGLQLGYCIY